MLAAFVAGSTPMLAGGGRGQKVPRGSHSLHMSGLSQTPSAASFDERPRAKQLAQLASPWQHTPPPADAAAAADVAAVVGGGGGDGGLGLGIGAGQ